MDEDGSSTGKSNSAKKLAHSAKPYSTPVKNSAKLSIEMSAASLQTVLKPISALDVGPER